jgi:DNA (cytosine-5)-methyltransferase 1
MRPRLLDLFCCAGGAAMGYHRAGFDVVGVDIAPQPHYPFESHQADALEFISAHGHEFDAIHASPPCQPYSTGVVSRSSKWNHTKGKDEAALIGATHALLVASGKPWVIENVMGARAHMPSPWFALCGAMFDRPIPRHRAFSTSFYVLAPEHPKCRGLALRAAQELGWEYRDMSVTGKGRRAGTSERWAYLLGVDWPMTQHEMAESIPPVYTAHVGAQLMAHLITGAAA